ncbi:MAG TPA: prephenate dehydratase [Solirubrobacteraceae bacterium]|nr:prephenate dehydratase [Solirubrobacteraceae bacterium]
MRAAYLGPQGTFSEDALLATAPPDTDAVPLPTVDAVVRAVVEGEAERGVVPIESATEGSVDTTLDALAASPITIVAEVVRPISHALIARSELPLERITTVASHPQALAQCADFLRAELPWAAATAWSSTAEAVLETAARREPWAAIGTPRAAELYGCVVLRSAIEGRAGNETRFVWIAPEGTEPMSAATKTSLAFWGAGAADSGWLVRCLSEFAFRGLNLTRIESRPRKDRLGQYVFFLDLEGGTPDERVGAAIAGLRVHCDEVRVLGSYPAA